MSIKLKTIKTQIFPNNTMTDVILSFCHYRRYVYNKSLDIWNKQYLLFKNGLTDYPPSVISVKNEITKDKRLWEYQYSDRVKQFAVRDLGNAWSNFKNKTMPNHKKPKFKDKKNPKQSFKVDTAKIKNGKLILPKARQATYTNYPIRLAEYVPDGAIKQLAVTVINNKFYVSITIEHEPTVLLKTNKSIGIDLNVGNYVSIDSEGEINNHKIITKNLSFYYQRIAYYDKVMARKRRYKEWNKSNNYLRVKVKRARDYERVKNIQRDILHKYIYGLVNCYDFIHIEDLDVNRMKMGIASKGLHRSMFGEFRRILEYKVDWYGKKLIVCDRYYPSTQRCSNCGHVKTGDDKVTLSGNAKHKTKHDEYECYECGYEGHRDVNASRNILNYENKKGQA